MATKRNVELGTVGFNLEASDESLLRSLAALKQFGEQVNRAANATDEAGQRSYNTMVKVERALTSSFDKVSSLADGLNRVGAASDQISKLTSQFDALSAALMKARGGAEPHEFVRASVGLNAATQQATRSIKEQERATALLEAKQSALVRSWEQVANLSSRLSIRGASASDVEKLNAVYAQYASRLEASGLSTGKLKTATREYNMALGETTRQIRENLAQQLLAERQQGRLIAATRNVAYLNARTIRTGLPNTYVDDNNNALKNFGSALQGGKQNEIVAAQQRLNDAMMSTRLAMAGAEKPTSRMSIVMHDLSKATVLALGPLSGVGSRIAVMTSLLDSNSVSVALFIGGLVAAGSALTTLSSAAVRATVDQQKFDALLISSTGSALLVGQEYKYLLDTSNRLGINVRGLVKPYSDFAAAARISNMPLQDQRKIFEGIITTSTSLHWTQEQLSRAFLAVTQMINKGTIGQEEFKRQLGELVPGILALGDAAAGTAQGGFLKMMTSGEALTSKYLPKIIELMEKIYSPGAIKGAEGIVAQQNRFSNALFETLKAFDQASGASEAWRKIVMAATAAVIWLKDNMTVLVGVMAMLAGAAVGGGLIRVIAGIMAGTSALTGAVGYLTAAIASARVAILAIQSTTIVGWLITLAGAAVGAAAAWHLFKDGANAAATAGDNINGKVKEWIDQQKTLGMSQEQVKSQMVAQVGTRLATLSSAIAKEKELLGTLKTARESAAKAAPYGMEHNPNARSPNAAVSEPAGAAQSRKRLEALEKEQAELIQLAHQMSAIKIAPVPAVIAESDKAWESWSSRINSAINSVKGKVAELEGLKNGGQEAQNLAKALTKAKEMIADMPKNGGNLKEISQRLTEAGFAGKDLVEQFTAMYLAEEKATDGIRDFGKAAKEQEAASKKVADIWTDLFNRSQAISGNVGGIDPENAANAKKLIDNLDTLRASLDAVGVSTEAADIILQAYAEQWKNVSGAEEHQKEIEKVTRQLETMGLKLGDSEAKINAQYAKVQAVVQRAVQLRVLTEAEGNEMILQAAIDRDRKLYKGANEFYQGIQQLFSKAESAMVDAFTNGGDDASAAFTKMAQTILKEIAAFVVKMAIIRPLMTSLFGGLYSGQGGGNGAWGDAILAIGRFFMGSSSGDIALGSRGAGGGYIDERASGGGVNPFTDYLVGEEGPEILRLGKDGGTVVSNARASKMSGGSMQYSDNSRNIYHIDGRADVAQTMQMLARTTRRNNENMQRLLKVRYG